MLDDTVTLQAERRPGVREPAVVVRAHQEELLRAAFLLTGSVSQAAQLASDVAQTLLRPLLRAQEEREWRGEFMAELANRYLHDPSAPRTAAAVTSSVPALDGGPGRYSVDDERTRMWAALERCEPRQRLALVLRDFDQLDEEQVCALVHRPPAELRGWLNTARERLRDAAGARPDQSAQALLLALSLGAPRVDLWPELAGPARRMAEQERRRRQLITGGLAAALVLAVLVGAVWLAGGWLRGDSDDAVAAVPSATLAPLPTPTPRPSATPTPPPMVRPVADVPDVQILGYSFPSNTGGQQRGASLFFDPVNGVRSTVEELFFFYPIGITPDGSRLVHLSVEYDPLTGAAQSSVLICVDAASGEVLWEQAVAIDAQPAVLNDRVIGYVYDPSTDDTPHLVVYDAFDGSALQTVAIDFDTPAVNWSQITQPAFYLAPDLSQLHLVAGAWDQLGGLTSTVVLTYGLPDLVLLHSSVVEYEDDDPVRTDGFSFWNAQVTPDGRALYALVLSGEFPRVLFLDLTTGALSDIELPMSTPNQPGSWPVYHVAGSHDGQRLYVISLSGEVSVIDLQQQRITESFPLDTAGYTFPEHDATTWLWGSETALFSPDGSRLYLFDVWSGVDSSVTPMQPSIIWAVDVATWRIAARWEAPGLIVTPAVNADGSRLYFTLATVTAQAGAQTGYAYQFWELDTASGLAQLVDAELPSLEGVSGLWLFSLQQFYRQEYGVTPPAGGIAPVDLPEYETLPRVALEVSDELPAAGQQVRFTIRFLHPRTGSPLTSRQPGVRFDPSAGVTLTLSHPDLADVIVFPLRMDSATFEAALPIVEHGPWQATVTVSNLDGTTWSQQWLAVVNATPSFEAEDGKRYQFRLQADPATPVIDQPVTLRVVLVDIESGAPLPEGVEFAGGLPDEIDVAFTREDSAFKLATLEADGHGVYTAETVFPWSGVWQADLSFRIPGDSSPPVHVSGGSLEVKRP